MAYTKQTWTNLPSETTPFSATRMEHIEDGIYDAHNLAKDAICVMLSANTTIAVTAWDTFNIPYNKVKYNIGNKFTFNTSTNEVVYSGNRPLKITNHINRMDTTTSALVYPTDSVDNYYMESASVDTPTATHISYKEITTTPFNVRGRIRCSSTGNAILKGDTNSPYSYLIVEEM